MSKLEINGDVRRSFLFPADIETAFQFYGRIENMLDWLPHIDLLEKYADDQYRMMYLSTELGIYWVRIICDLQAVRDCEQKILYFKPLSGKTAVKARADFHTLLAQGEYASESIFKPEGEETRIDYHLRLKSSLPVPLAAKLMIPGSMLERIAHSIMYRRINEIAEGFIERSLQAYAVQGYLVGHSTPR